MKPRRSQWDGVEWRQEPRGGSMSDCANGGRNVYQPACNIRIEFDAGRPWVYPLALNGRTIDAVSIGGMEYAPKNRVDAIPKQADWNPLSTTHSCSGCGRPLIVDSPNECVNHRFCPGCGAEINQTRKEEEE